MRIAGINSPNYHLNQQSKPQKTPAHDGDSSATPHSTESKAISNSAAEDQPLAFQQKVTGKKIPHHQNPVAVSNERVRFYNQIEGSQAGSWQTYSSNGQAAASPTPDNTSHKARAAISEYLQTQYIEERLHFKAVLGIDDSA